MPFTSGRKVTHRVTATVLHLLCCSGERIAHPFAVATSSCSYCLRDSRRTLKAGYLQPTEKGTVFIWG